MFEHDFVEKHKITRNDSETGRTYTINDVEGFPEYRSVTSILATALDKGYLDDWIKRVGIDKAEAIKISAGNRGTHLHEVMESYLLNCENILVARMPATKMAFRAIKPWIDEYVGKVYGIELPLYSHKLKAAGTTDLFAQWKGNPAIVDFKTSTKAKKKEYIYSYFLQKTAYAIMIEELYHIRVDDIVCVMAVDNDRPILFEEKTQNYYKDVYKIFKGE